MLLTGILIIVLGRGWAFSFSKRFTEPIIKLNNISQKMAKLDFTEKCTVKKEDEIGELAKNINYLSHKLDQTLLELQQKNKKLIEDIERERRIDEMRKEFVSSVSHLKPL